MSIEYNNFSLSKNEETIISSLSLRTASSGIIAVMGVSGSGKSTLLKVTNRIIEPGLEGWHINGDISFRGKSIFSPDVKPENLRQQIGLVLQEPVAFRGTMVENVAFALRFGHLKIKRQHANKMAEDVLEQVGLASEVSDINRVKASELSGGQLQRLAIARAIAIKPKVLMMDEPTSALDPIATESIEQVVLQLSDEILIVLVTHNPSQARRLADEALFMEKGKSVHGAQSIDQLFRSSGSKAFDQFLSVHQQ
ncbi:phosphate ABC transporter ATP-binding protein [Aliikangiella coralliicola]|nr:phosphate ABC transporter ATP-binding protein [Aliikangiella coralliicola]